MTAAKDQQPVTPLVVPDYPTMWCNRLAATAACLERFVIRPQVSNRLQHVAFDDVCIRAAAVWGDKRDDAYSAFWSPHHDLGFDQQYLYGTRASVPIIHVDAQGYKRNFDREVPGGRADANNVVTVNSFPT